MTSIPRWAGRILPGLLLCIVITLVAGLLQHVEESTLGRAWLESLVLSIILGTVVRTFWAPGLSWTPGIEFSAKMLLEIAVVMLGASISATTALALGSGLLAGIVLVVVVALPSSYLIGRTFQLPPRMAILVACGNSICGNSAIAAVAPVIGADGEDVAGAIAFTAVLGVIVVLCLPLLAPLLGMTETQYGALAGLTVYAVPQVLAATIPIGALSNQVGTLVKLVRVLMLGPVVVALSLGAGWHERRSARGAAPARVSPAGTSASGPSLVPWFIVGFLAMAALRTAKLLPESFITLTAHAATLLTVVSMAALGLGVDMRSLARVGGRIAAAVSCSLLAIIAISLTLIHVIKL
jgi:uncharacterized integral membrane protein (TIGR00698 family)